MRSRLNEHYTGIKRIDVLYAGPNSFDGTRPHIWYVIAEARAASRVDGASLGHQGCDAPGSYFLQTEEGWVWVPEGAFPGIVGFWMDVFGMAGPGLSTPSTDWPPLTADQVLHRISARFGGQAVRQDSVQDNSTSYHREGFVHAGRAFGKESLRLKLFRLWAALALALRLGQLGAGQWRCSSWALPGCAVGCRGDRQVLVFTDWQPRHPHAVA
jgi:hypothetical protein